MDAVQLPTIELHAHLNGSISPATMRRLLEAKRGILPADELARIQHLVDDTKRDLQTCFDLFGCIYKLVDNLAALEMITRDVLHEFQADGIVYLELRSTPKAFADSTKQQYVETILRVMDAFQAEHTMWCRLIISIDRTKGSQEMTLHLAELDTPDEAAVLLATNPDRIGHGTFLTYTRADDGDGGDEDDRGEGNGCGDDAGRDCGDGDDNKQPVRGGVCMDNHRHVPIEVCLTSNIRCKTVDTAHNHHISDIVRANQPFCICTDDKGVFATTVSREWDLAISSGHLQQSDVTWLTTITTAYTFLPTAAEVASGCTVAPPTKEADVATTATMDTATVASTSGSASVHYRPRETQEALLERMVAQIRAVVGTEAQCATPADLTAHHQHRHQHR
ncbi:hypothetical protein PTSG_12929 [Salpingoeca rosetta]|uniref:Adenosine deaminase domain-containing protein n=1 Tax=Salpingoeca rosetta (strain ATCC 50818 / BSB-021) TaxID=946362 RepID=F2UP49_SALR5|nr:uncharacterized protein PTSG_12929 [Salpingoeca rosetta]EGD79404.1 hypothetical protein PTSG_12929 [Salpingoeca rosetta]|eukprot:XP_004989173.1 hypothetical protein PTSG_12929 [Salpingoeca rosetta]